MPISQKPLQLIGRDYKVEFWLYVRITVHAFRIIPVKNNENHPFTQAASNRQRPIAEEVGSTYV